MDTPIEELILSKKFSQLLVMNSWRYEIPDEQRNIIIANALNTCVEDLKFKISGYLITNRRVFIIGSSATIAFQDILYHFYHQVEQEIISYKKIHNQYNTAYHIAHNTQHNLFTIYPFYNDHIKSLITGEKVKLNYYDPDLDRLRAYLHHHRYCSVLDYLGGESPVDVYTGEL